MDLSIRRFIRSSIKKLLPTPLSEAIRSRYYVYWMVPRLSDADEPDLTAVRAFLRRGDTVIDAGANFGRYTVAMAASVAHTGRVLAIEPIPVTFRVLDNVVRHGGLKQVTCVNMAVSDHAGSSEMTIPEMRDGLNFYRASLDQTHGAGQSVSVEMDTLDLLSKGLAQPPVFVKMDLEGHERTALKGASGLLDAGVAWLLELPDNHDDSAAIDDLMRSHGYAGLWYDAASETLRSARQGDTPINLFYFKEKHLERFHDAPFRIELSEPPDAEDVSV